MRDVYENKVSTAIQPLQWSILRYIKSASDAAKTTTAMSTFLGLTTSPVIRATATLVKKGYLLQTPNPEDARSRILLLTQDGERVLDEDPLKKIVARMHRVDMKDQEVFRETLRNLVLIDENVEANE